MTKQFAKNCDLTKRHQQSCFVCLQQILILYGSLWKSFLKVVSFSYNFSETCCGPTRYMTNNGEFLSKGEKTLNITRDKKAETGNNPEGGTNLSNHLLRGGFVLCACPNIGMVPGICQ